jgi:hypothetical protein
MHLGISSSLPITGSSFPAFAMAVKSFPYFSSASYFPSGSVIIKFMTCVSLLSIKLVFFFITMLSKMT